MITPKWLRVRFQQLQILHQNPTVEAYYSVTFHERLYFSSVFDDQLTLQVKNEMIIPLDGASIETISLQRWESHVIVFDHQISLTELKTKTIIKKKFQARKNQIITFTVELCGQDDLIFCDKMINKTMQHYLVLQNIKLRGQSSHKRGDFGACFFKIKTSKNEFDIPVQNGNCLIHLPETFQIFQYKNSKLFSQSKNLTFNQINDNLQEIQLFAGQGNNAGKVIFNSRWIVDVSVPLHVHYLLLHSIEILISEFELKFDVPNDFVGSKIKIICNNKIFQLNDQLGNSKMVKIRKAVWIVCKTPQDLIQIKIQRNDQTLSKVDIFTQELHFCQLLKHKQKMMDFNNPLKALGMIKFNIHKTKGATSPQHDQFWRDSLKKKSSGSLLIQQCSICYDNDQETSITIKTENQQKSINKLSNINFFEQEPLIYHTPILINPKPEQTIYFMLKSKEVNSSSEDFIGIAVLSMADIKLGKNPYEIDFYKNQQKLGSMNCLITKYLPLTFVKSSFQPEILPLMKVADLKLSINTLTLSPYFFSYKYDAMSEVFCIVQVNRIKKVLILQPTYQQLSFIPSSTSDNLKFSVDVEQVLKLKITMMIGDGLNEEIYGTVAMTFKMEELREKQQISKKNVQFMNFAETVVGKCNLVVHLQQEIVKKIEKSKSKQKLPFQSGRNRSSNSKKQQQNKKKAISVLQMMTPQQKQIKIIKNLLPTKRHVRKSLADQSYQSEKKRTAQRSVYGTAQREEVKLPLIREKKRKQSFSDLLMSMNMRKRTKGGYDYNRTQQGDKTARDYLLSSKKPSIRQKQKSIDYHSLRNNNPNIDKNLEMLFPPRKGQTKEQQIKNQLNKYQEKLRGLKSVLNEISNDIDPIQPSVKDGNHTEDFSHGQINNFQYAGNQFL